MTNTPRRFDENPNTTTNLQKDSTEYFGISQSGASKVIKTADAFTKANVGLSEVDNTSDANKPISVAQQIALDLKADESELLALGEIAGTAYEGSKGKANANNIATVDGRQNVLLDNKVVNGDFTDGINNWSNPSSILTVLGNVCTTIATDLYGGSIQSLTMVPDDIYFLYSKAKTYSPNVRLYHFNLDTDYNKTVGDNSFNIETYRGAAKSSEGRIGLRDFNSENWENFYSTDFIFLNLTEIFCRGIQGTGKEPSLELMQKFIETTGYFESTHTMTNLEIMNAYNNYIEELETTKADIVQEDWIEPTLLNGWTGIAKYRKNQFGVVEVYIALDANNGASGTVAFNLPSEYLSSFEIRNTLATNSVNDGAYAIFFGGTCVIYKSNLSDEVGGTCSIFPSM